jgi:dTDP-4-amino-4,6-dideoxygalactose transaminase
MDGIQGAVLRVKLKSLERGNEARRTNARLYGKLLAGVEGLIVEPPADYGTHVYHVYVVRVKERDRILQAMGQRGIACGIHYPKPVHLQKAYQSLGLGVGSFPVAERCAGEILSLPMFPELTPAQIETVARELKALLPAAGKSGGPR